MIGAEQNLRASAVVSFTEWHNTASQQVMKRIGMSYAGEIHRRGLVEGQEELDDDARFAVYVKALAGR